MSDGMTDAYRMQRDAEEFGAYLKTVGKYLAEQTEQDLAVATSSTYRMLRKRVSWRFSDEHLHDRAEYWLAELKDGNHRAWASLLADAWQTREFAPLKALSPFKDKVLLFVHDLCGSRSVSGELERLAPVVVDTSPDSSPIRHYVVVLDAPAVEAAERIVIRERK